MESGGSPNETKDQADQAEPTFEHCQRGMSATIVEDNPTQNDVSRHLTECRGQRCQRLHLHQTQQAVTWPWSTDSKKSVMMQLSRDCIKKLPRTRLLLVEEGSCFQITCQLHQHNLHNHLDKRDKLEIGQFKLPSHQHPALTLSLV